MAASVALTDLIKTENHSKGLFGRNPRILKADFILGKPILLLNHFVKSFIPVLNFEEQLSYSRARHSEGHDQDPLTVMYLKALRQHVAENRWSSVMMYVNSLFTRSDERLLSMRSARKRLFDFDSSEEPECGDFDIEAWRCDEMVDCEVYEPQMLPEKDPHSSCVALDSDTSFMWRA
ncbi:uncharacterized protein RAG0_15129 [Rhynchosporium agropyri]|uniref:Uncharacterized protein n=1 Tax=Rhynchosporium agropyri TaxID=914238 RepID=A0A1E1LJS3_9HELO|nr:uncharacterized protein RAG0_15129 [Rhynchosporium agropyri]